MTKLRQYDVVRAPDPAGRARARPPTRVPSLPGNPILGHIHDHAESEATRLAETATALARDWRAASLASGTRRDGSSTASAPAGRLDPMSAQRLGAAFGADLSGVRIHTGPRAEQTAASIGARAFAHGQDLYFGRGEHDPHSRAGSEVLRHELAHAALASRHAGAGASTVRRYPATALSAPVRWQQLTADVGRSGEGASGGVFILRTNEPNPVVKTVIVKPIFGKSGLGTKESGAQMTFGDRALASLFGINTPASRVVPKGSPEFDELVALCSPKVPKPSDAAAASQFSPRCSSPRSARCASATCCSATTTGWWRER